MKRSISPVSRQTVRSTHWYNDYDRSEVVRSTRRRKNDVILHRFQRGDLFVLLLSLIAASSDAMLFKRGRVGHSGWGKGKNLGRDKVKEDVAWILEDTSEEGWKPVSDDGHVKVWKRFMPGSEFVAVKSSARLSVSPQSLFEVLTPGDIDIVRKYNPMVDDGTDLEVVDRDNKVSWSATMAIWPCRPRDFVTHIRRTTLDDGSVAIVNSATTHPKAPGSARYVRGEILHGVFHIKPADDKKHSEFTMVHHFNPGGSVPAWLINWLAEGKPVSFVRRLEDVAKQWDERAADYKKHHKSMPCKGRGFADKPCAFLLSAKDVDSLPGPSRSWSSWLGGSSRILALLMAALATAASVWYGWAAACRGWPQLWTDKDASALSTRGNDNGDGGGRSYSNGTEPKGGVGSGVDTPSKGAPSDLDATLDAKASGDEKSAGDTSTDESVTLGPCDVANGRAEGGQKKGVDDDGESVVASKEDASGGVRGSYDPCVVPNDVPGPNGEVGDRTISSATKPEGDLAVTATAAALVQDTK